MSDLLKKPCSCKGNNPNCFKCGGWGYIDSVAESRKPTGQGELVKSSKNTKNYAVSFKRNSVLEKHKTISNQSNINKKIYNKKSNNSLADYFTNLDSLEEINFGECLFCGYPILKRNIESHIRQYHRNCTKNKKNEIRIALNLLFIKLD